MNDSTYWNEFFVLPERTSIAGIAILGFVFLSRRVRSYDPLRRFYVLNHERIHVRQWIETGFLLFAVWYVVEFLFRYVRYKNWDEAYRNISFEREAYANQYNPLYLSDRRFWPFIKYI